ncbi:AtpZ/AtpI family protein [Paenibacillus sp. y28]|uniref:AtpZ/AtpI family protein n=1 Tax=Paenibacillus sp. y28 TaxID=3129110 RepID=UPI0030185D65
MSDQSSKPWKAIGLVSAIGIDLGVCVVAGFWAGQWVGGFFGGHPLWIAGGVLAGLAVSIVSIVYLLKPFSGG